MEIKEVSLQYSMIFVSLAVQQVLESDLTAWKNCSNFVTVQFALNQHQELCCQHFYDRIFCSEFAWFKKRRSGPFTTCILTFGPRFGQGACPETAPTCSIALASIHITRRMNCEGKSQTKHLYVQN